jgi:hypothetical protein
MVEDKSLKMHSSCVLSALLKPTTYGTVPATYKHDNSSDQSNTCPHNKQINQ